MQTPLAETSISMKSTSNHCYNSGVCGALHSLKMSFGGNSGVFFDRLVPDL